MKDSLSMETIIQILTFANKNKLFKIKNISSLELRPVFYGESGIFEITLRDMSSNNKDEWLGEVRTISKKDFPTIEDLIDYD